MALEQLRSRWEAVLPPLLKLVGNASPSTLTWAALPFGVAGAVCIAMAGMEASGSWLLLAGAAFVGISMILDGLDGFVARNTGQVSRWGDYLDHTLDRVLDAVWVLALAANATFVGDVSLGFAAAWFTLLGSYMGTQAQAVAGSRNYRGFSRADRTVMTLAAVVLPPF